jgi:hypothetical protein
MNRSESGEDSEFGFREIEPTAVFRRVVPFEALERRIPDKQTLIEEIAAWEHDRNANHTKADYPSI